MYGFLGIGVASASILGSLLSKRLLTIYQPEKIILIGIRNMLLGAVFLLFASVATVFPEMRQFWLILLGLLIMLTGMGIALPNCLSLALVDFQDVIGTAGAIFSLGYYLLVSLFTFGMSKFHNGTLLAMPLYFLVLGSVLFCLTRKFLLPKANQS